MEGVERQMMTREYDTYVCREGDIEFPPKRWKLEIVCNDASISDD